MNQPYCTQRRVEFRDTDAAGIMHFSAFFTYMEQVEHEMLRSLGLSVMQSEGDTTIGWPRVSSSCDYKGTVRFEDLMDIQLQIVHIGGKSIRYQHQFSCGEKHVATGEMVAVCCRIDREHNLRSIQIPKELRILLARHQSV